MLKIYGILFFLVFISNVVFAQAVNPARQYEQQRDSQSPADGVWYVYDKNGNLSKEEHYKSYRLDGEVKSFYPGGSIKATTPYIDGKRQGMEKTYYEQGGLKGENVYVKNNLNGISRQYYDNGALMKAADYSEGQLDGTTKEYYDNGSLKQIWNYSHGVINGAQLSYSPDGQIKSEDDYLNGVQVAHKDYSTEVASFTSPSKKPSGSNADQRKPAPTITPPVPPASPDKTGKPQK